MAKIKPAKSPNKLSERPRNMDYPVFCFRHLTTNKAFLISPIKSVRDKAECYDKLIEKLEDIQSVTWLVFSGRPKKTGMELIPNNQININAKGLELTKDSKLVVIQFNNHKYRIIAHRSQSDNILHIIGYDLEFNAYNHG